MNAYHDPEHDSHASDTSKDVSQSDDGRLLMGGSQNVTRCALSVSL